MKKLLYILFFSSLLGFSQSKSYADHKNTMDSYLSDFQSTLGGSGGSTGYKNGGGLYLQANEQSHGAAGQYFQGYGVLLGLQMAWQASGQNSYFDKILDIVEADIAGAPQLDTFFVANGLPNNSYNHPRIPYKGWVVLPNYYQNNGYTGSMGTWFYEGNGWNAFFPPLQVYVNNADGSLWDFDYESLYQPSNPSSSLSQGPLYTHNALQNNIYNRYYADAMRIAYKYPAFLSQTSGNGQTYQTRIDAIVAHLEVHVWEKWVESNYNASQYKWNVYRTNTHMSSHLASIALSLYSIKGTQKYLDFVEEYLWDFGSNPKAKDSGGNQDTQVGVGLMDQFYNETGSTILYYKTWGGGQTQDESHAGAEYHFLYQCYNEGIGGSPPNSERAVDLSLMQKLAETYRLSLLSAPKTPDQGQALYAVFATNVLADQENSGSNTSQSHWSGINMYAAAVLGVNGSPAPVYLSDGSSAQSDFPTITLTGASTINLTVGDTYTELGAVYNDLTDGTGAATVGGDTVSAGVAGTYVVTYNYTDTDTNTAPQVSRTVIVSDSAPSSSTGSSVLPILIIQN